jgi:ABC-type transporter Mla subunit MlaD
MRRFIDALNEFVTEVRDSPCQSNNLIDKNKRLVKLLAKKNKEIKQLKYDLKISKLKN